MKKEGRRNRRMIDERTPKIHLEKQRRKKIKKEREESKKEREESKVDFKNDWKILNEFPKKISRMNSNYRCFLGLLGLGIGGLLLLLLLLLLLSLFFSFLSLLFFLFSLLLLLLLGLI